MSAITPALIQSAQSGDESAKAAIYEAVRPMLRSIAGEFAGGDSRVWEELEQEAAMSMLNHLAGYKLDSRASLTTYLHSRVRQDVRNAHFAFRSGGSMDGDTYAEYTRVAGRVHAEVRAERNQGADVIRDGEVHDRIRGGLMSLPGKHAWSEERFLAAHDLVHLGAQSMEEEDENGAEFGASLADHEDPYAAITSDFVSRAKAVSRMKREMVAELLEHLNDSQRAVIEGSFGLGRDKNQVVDGLLEKRITGGSTRLEERFGLTYTKRTDDDLAASLGITRATVRQIRKRALAKLAKVSAEWTYPTIGQAVTPEEQAVIDAVADNDEGTYVRVWEGRVGKGRKLVRDAEFQVINNEGDRVVVAMSLGRAVELELLAGVAEEREIPTSPEEGYTFMRLFGAGEIPAERQDDVFDSGARIVAGVDAGPGSFDVEERQGRPILPVSDATYYAAPLWDHGAAWALEVIGRRAYLAKTRR